MPPPPLVFEHDDYAEDVEWDNRGSLAQALRRYEGFWGDSRTPEAKTDWEPASREEWIRKLLRLEDALRRHCLTDGWDSNSLFPRDEPRICFIRTHGAALCRVCGAENATGTYYYPSRPMREVDPDTEVLMWPEGYAHYIIHHGVVPSRAFYNFVSQSGIDDDIEPMASHTTDALAARGVLTGGARRAELNGCD